MTKTKKDETRQAPTELLKKTKDGSRLSKLGKWLWSDSKPLMDLSGLDEREKVTMMRLILK